MNKEQSINIADTPPPSTMERKTVAVVDMVGYSSVAKIVEDHLDALSVADLNKQIQDLIMRSLDQ